MASGLRIWKSPVIIPIIGVDAYTAGDAVGAKQLVLGAPEAGVIRSIVISDDNDQDKTINVWLFDSEPATIADDAALELSDASADKVIDMVICDNQLDGVNNRISVEAPNVYYRGDLWFQLEDVETATYTALGLKVRFIIEH